MTKMNDLNTPPDDAAPSLAFLFNVGRIERLGEAGPEEFFYGARSMAVHGFRTRMFGAHPPSQGLIDNAGRVYGLPAPVVRFIRALRGTQLVFVARMLQCFAGRHALNRADCIITITSPWTHGINLLRRLGIIRKPVIGIAIGPYPVPVTFGDRLVKWAKRFLYAGTDLVFLAEPDRQGFLANISASARRTRTIPFGVDEAFWTSGPGTGDYVLSLGYAGRDYPLLLQAWAARPEHLLIVTSITKGLEALPPTVERRSGSWHTVENTDAEIRDFYRNARFVVVPLHESMQPCGQSTVLQAMACEKAVILTTTSGLWDHVVMEHGVNCILVPPGDLAALNAAIDRLLAHPEEAAQIGVRARQTVLEHYSNSVFVRDLATQIRDWVKL